jgi:hypothetical protein
LSGYIAHRLKVAGGDVEQIFSPNALKLIIRRTKGVPRRANILCHNALLFAYGRHLPQVGVREAREAIAEMDERRRAAWEALRAAAPALEPRRVALGRRARRRVAVGTAASFIWSLPSRSGPAPAAVAEPAPQPDAARHADSGSRASRAGRPCRHAERATRRRRGRRRERRRRGGEAGRRGEGRRREAVVRRGRRRREAGRRGEAAVAEKPVVAARKRAAAARPRCATRVRAPADPSPSDEDDETSVAREPRAPWSCRRGARLDDPPRVYGDEFSRIDRAALYDRVRMLNPQVKDVNVIMAGDRIVVPVVARGEP